MLALEIPVPNVNLINDNHFGNFEEETVIKQLVIALLLFILLFFSNGPSMAQISMQIEPTSVVTSADGSEMVANFLITYSDGFQEVVELHANDSGFSTPGGVRIDPVELFWLFTNSCG